MMQLRTAFASIIVAAGLLAVTPASAQELREPNAHFIVDVPDNWAVATEANYAVAYPKDESFHLRMVATEHGLKQTQDDEEHVLSFLKQHFNDIRVDKHAKRLNYNNFVGIEVFGTGKEKNGQPGRFFVLLLVDKRDAKKGAVVLGTGTNDGFQKHHPGIYEALHTMRTY
jgi:hypothetical protein